jgi:hypothetical protein
MILQPPVLGLICTRTTAWPETKETVSTQDVGYLRTYARNANVAVAGQAQYRHNNVRQHIEHITGLYHQVGWRWGKCCSAPVRQAGGADVLW